MTFNDMVKKQREKSIGKDYMGELKGQMKAEMLGKIDNLYHSFFEIDETIPNESPLKEITAKIYDSIVEFNKAVNEIYKDW